MRVALERLAASLSWGRIRVFSVPVPSTYKAPVDEHCIVLTEIKLVGKAFDLDRATNAPRLVLRPDRTRLTQTSPEDAVPAFMRLEDRDAFSWYQYSFGTGPGQLPLRLGTLRGQPLTVIPKGMSLNPGPMELWMTQYPHHVREWLQTTEQDA